MKIKIEIKSTFGKVLFEFEKENNTIKDTLIEANLYGANLRGANLREADLYGANLRGANLREADLRGANLYGANLYGANLRGANLRGADLRGADLRGANLYGANPRGANLRGADLYGALNADLVIAHTRILPEGDLIGYKKCKDNIIVKLKIPADAKRSHALGRKCRAEFAEVLEIFGVGKAYSQHDGSFEYEVGKIVKPTAVFDENWVDECSTGIHFFITKIEAENY